MNQTNKSLLVMFVGVPGSGKTTFARQLAVEINAVALNSDAIRLSMWGNRETIFAMHADLEERNYGNKLTFGAMDYATSQILKSGRSVIYDANANGLVERDKNRQIALKHDALAIVVHIQTPPELAIERMIKRQATEDQNGAANPERARVVVERFVAEIEEPDHNENVITISGEVPFSEQLAVFNQQLQDLDY